MRMVGKADQSMVRAWTDDAINMQWSTSQFVRERALMVLTKLAEHGDRHVIIDHVLTYSLRDAKPNVQQEALITLQNIVAKGPPEGALADEPTSSQLPG